MNHLPFTATPVTRLSFYSTLLGVNLVCKRDDLFQEAGGGNKARMLQYILAEINPRNCDVLVTAGGPCSNFNRACALMCARLGMPMHLVEYTENPDEFDTSLNYYLCRLAGVTTTRCSKADVPRTIERVLEDYRRASRKTFFIYGGGKSLEGIHAYYDAVRELADQQKEIDHLFVACGTGTTLTGICAGMQQYYPHAMVHAISTARTWEQEKPVLQDDMAMLNDHLGTQYTFGNLDFSERYLCGGYAKYSPELMNTIQECISHEGMIIDPTYSGKAFYGMKRILSSSDRFKGNNVLFWNTGGIFNLLSARG